MTALKIAKVPDRTPVKIGLSITPALHAALQGYALAYHDAYGEEIALTDLVPIMLENFLASDRAFAKYRSDAVKS